MGILLQDLRLALRRSLRQPGYAAAVVLTIALTIAANAALFSVVHAVLLRQMPFQDAERLVWIWNRRVDRDKAFFSVPDLLDYREQSRTLEEIAAFTQWGVNLTGDGQSERLTGVRLTGNAMPMLGVRPLLGRAMQPADTQPGAPPVVMLTFGLWQRMFAADPAVLGRSLRINGENHAIVGVLPPEFFFPGNEGELAGPLALENHPRRKERDTNFLRVYARRRPEATLSQVQAEMAAICDRLRAIYPENSKKAAPQVLELHREVVGEYRAALLILWAAVGVVLLVACTNLAGLFLAQCVSRRQELSLRGALGAGRARLVRQLVTESALLSLMGGGIGVALASLTLDLLLTLSPSTLPRLAEVRVDATVLAFSLSASLIAGILFGLLPAVQVARRDLLSGLGSARAAGSQTGARMRSALMVSQVALAALLCILAGWVARSFQHVQALDPGVRAENLLLTRVSLSGPAYRDRLSVATYLERVFDQLRAQPGVAAVAAANAVPLSGLNTRNDFTIVEKPPADPDKIPGTQSRWISHGYFAALGISILKGREFTAGDTEQTQVVAVIDEALAREFFAGDDPIGKHLRLAPDTGNLEAEIVGVVGNVKHFGLEDEPLSTFYMPIPQMPQNRVAFLLGGISIAVRTEKDPLAFAETARRSLQAVDPSVPASPPRSMAQSFAAATAARRFNMQVMLAFALATVGLAAMGLYAVMAYNVQQSRREFGVRMALGARPVEVLAVVLKSGLRLGVAGLAIGFLLAQLAARGVSGMLFHVRLAEPTTYVAVAALVVAVLLAACYLPARRAARVDPMVALRYE